MSKSRIKLKELGLFLVVEEDNEEKLVFYRAYFTKEDIINALEKDKNLKNLIKELKPVDLVIATLTEDYKQIRGEDK